jgi:hypothetical protein
LPKKVKTGDLSIDREVNPLIEDIKKWSKWILGEAKEELTEIIEFLKEP